MRLDRGTTVMLTAALRYARQGWRVLPLRGKTPLTPNGVHDATTDEDTIREWWAEWPNANVGYAMDGRVAIDVDKGSGGFESLAELVKQHGEFPSTRKVETGGGGVHLIYLLNGRPLKNSASKLGRGLDVKTGPGAYLVAPPSVHPETKDRYEIVDELEPQPLPSWVAEIAGRPSKPERGAAAALGSTLVELLAQPATAGGRNEWLAKVAGHYAKRHPYRDDYNFHVEQANETLAEPLSAAEVRKVADSIWKAEQQRSQDAGLGHTDLGNARRLVVSHGHELRYCNAWGLWLIWDGRRWRRDLTQEVERRAKDTVRRIYTEAATAESEADRKSLAKWAVQSESAARLRDLVRLAQSEPEIAVAPDDLDADPWLLNVANGTLDLRTGDLRPHDPADHITRIAPVDYDPDAPHGEWSAFLDRVTQGDDGLASYLQRTVGYSLTGRVSEQALFFLYGSGANGKSTFTEVLLKLLGDYGKQADPELLLARSGDVHPTGIADLQGARLVVCAEVEEGRRWAEVTVKQLTGGDRIKARFMRQDFFEFAPTFKIWLAANHKPTVRGSDHAIWRRLKLIGFEARIPADEQIPDYHERLVADEAAGILRWAVEGCLSWQRDGLVEPKAVRAAVDEYRAEEDVLAAFLEECCEIEPQDVLLLPDDSSRWFATNSQLMHAYQEWAKANGERPLNQRELGRALQERGFESGRRRVGRGRLGIRVRMGR